ncbi:hypothetical protein L1887_15310 [Cichorium endivia]|nr:hypothetical protein L1887_15310 [Cichorium endivia]
MEIRSPIPDLQIEIEKAFHSSIFVNRYSLSILLTRFTEAIIWIGVDFVDSIENGREIVSVPPPRFLLLSLVFLGICKNQQFINQFEMRLTALDLIQYATSDEHPRQFCSHADIKFNMFAFFGLAGSVEDGQTSPIGDDNASHLGGGEIVG